MESAVPTRPTVKSTCSTVTSKVSSNQTIGLSAHRSSGNRVFLSIAFAFRVRQTLVQQHPRRIDENRRSRGNIGHHNGIGTNAGAVTYGYRTEDHGSAADLNVASQLGCLESPFVTERPDRNVLMEQAIITQDGAAMNHDPTLVDNTNSTAHDGIGRQLYAVMVADIAKHHLMDVPSQ